MARYIKGILGPLQGTVGTVVGGSWNGIDYLRSRPKKSNRSASKLQIIQRAKFALVGEFLKGIVALLALAFRDKRSGISDYNGAFRFVFENALTGNYPAFLIDYSKVLLTKGVLLNAGNPQSGAEPGRVVKFTWTDNSGIAMANADDKCILILYCPELNRFLYTTDAGMRSDASATIDAAAFSGMTVETWIGFISDEEVNVATSLYTGQVVVS